MVPPLPAAAPDPPPAVPTTIPVPRGRGRRFAIVGYDKREEYILSESEWRQTLGVGGYRQSVASRVLIIAGGLAAFGGAAALLATFGSLADNTAYGTQLAIGTPSPYPPYVYGFSAMLGAGGAMLMTGLILALPLPSRHRTLIIPRLQVVEDKQF